MGLPPVAPGVRARPGRAGSILGRRQAVGVVLAVALLLAGREARRRLLVGSDGAWRDHLWLDEVVRAPGAADPAEAPNGLATPVAAASGPAAAAPAEAEAPPPAAEAPGRPAGERPKRPRGAGKGPATGLTAPLRINRCSLDSLQLLPGVGPVLAARINESRRSGMIFRVPADLRKVKGIGPATMERLAPLVLFADPAPAAPSDHNPH